MNKPGTIRNQGAKKGGISYGWVVLCVCFITIVLCYGTRNTFSVFYPAIVGEFGWSRGDTALMFSVSLLFYGFIAPIGGGLVDRYNTRVLVLVGACAVGGGVALCGAAHSPWHFYASFGLLVACGLALAGWTPLAAIVSKWFTRRRGLAFGILSAAFGGSLVLASVAQFLISNFGWRIAYFIMGGSLIVIIVPLCGFLLRGSPQDKDLLPRGVPANTAATPEDAKLPKTGPGEAAMETAWTLPLALRNYRFWLLFLLAFCFLGLAEQIVIAHQVYFFRDVGYKPMEAANMYSAFGVTFVIGNLCSAFSDRFGREMVFIPSSLLCIVAVFLLFVITDDSQPWMALLVALCFGMGFGTSAPLVFTSIADIFQGERFGSILGSIVLGFSLGGAIAPWLAGFLHDKTQSYFSTFFVLLACFVVSIALMWLIAPSKVRRSTE
jgi:sugar phosphate permease